MSAGAREGTVVGVQRSPGGVPKLAVTGPVQVTAEGLEGDWQLDRKHHGGPDRAVCLFAHEVIEALAREGHPVSAGSLGENLTLGGLDWSLLGGGAVLRVGDALTLEITRAAHPCKTIAHCFADGAFVRVSEKTSPGSSRMYARVLQSGVVSVGDPVVITQPRRSAIEPDPIDD
ncbi:MAG: MOSC domain-containing protein [Deltaproteobacteria bacterium]|nr:MOSC domain-containing protein [Deltaproteobacteria bacterium]